LTEGDGKEAFAGAGGEGEANLAHLDRLVAGGGALRGDREDKNPHLEDENMVVRGQEELNGAAGLWQCRKGS
jgi:hypothetical protein